MQTTDEFEYVPNAHHPKDWQQAVTQALQILDSVCQENDISYSLCFGGLLGAVRHQGIIPWDNDVDVVMFEKDYLKLQQLALQGALPEEYTLVDRATEKDYPLLFGRFVDTRTSCPLSTSSFNGGTHGLFVDVFVLYPLNDDPELTRRQTTDFLVWEELTCWVKRRSAWRNMDFIKRWEEIKAFEAENGRGAALAKIEGDFRSLMPEEGEWCFHSSGGTFNGFPTFKTEWFRNTAYAPFGDTKLAVPVHAREVLQRFYGGNWRLFPKGESFKAYSGASLSIPSTVVTEDYMQFIDPNEAEHTLRQRKDLLMEETVLRCTSDLRLWHAEAEIAALEFDESHADEMAALDAVGLAEPPGFAAQDARERALPYLDLAAAGIAVQKRTHFATGHIAVPLDPAFTSSALWTYYLQEPDYWTVQKYIDRQREDTEDCTFDDKPANRALEQCLSSTARLYLANDAHDRGTMQRMAALLGDFCPSGRHTIIAEVLIALDIARDDIEGSAEELLVKSEEALELFPDDDYLRYAHAVGLAYGNRADEAEREFADFAARSSNGVLLMQAEKVCSDQCISFQQRKLVDARGRNIDTVKPPVPRAQPDTGIGGRYSTWRDFTDRGLKGLAVAKRRLDFGMRKTSDEAKEAAARVEPLNARYQEYRSLRRLTDRRIASWEVIYPRKQAICDAAAKGDLETVQALAKPYLIALYHAYDKNGKGLFIDQGIFDACRPVINSERGGDFVRSLESRIPAAHRIDMADMLKQKGVDHPYLKD